MDISQESMRRLNWYGLKKVVKHAAAFKPLNAPILQFINHNPALKRRTSRFPVALPQVECRVNGASFTMLDPLSCGIAKEVYWGGGERKAPEDRVAVKVFESLSREADWMLDIGAYTGYFSLLTCAVNPRARVIAFEIVPENYLLLVRNVMHNDFVGRIDARLNGLGAAGDSMRVPEAFHSSELPTSISRSYRSEAGVRIPFDSLDRLSGGLQGKGLLKVDVEGGEDVLFQHGREFLRQHRPDILCEVLSSSSSAAQLTAWFTGYGYRLYHVTDAGLVPHEAIKPHRKFKDWYFSAEDAAAFLRRAA